MALLRPRLGAIRCGPVMPEADNKGVWEELWSDEHARPYWYNTVTKQSSWTKPSTKGAPPPLKFDGQDAAFWTSANYKYKLGRWESGFVQISVLQEKIHKGEFADEFVPILVSGYQHCPPNLATMAASYIENALWCEPSVGVHGHDTVVNHGY